MKVLICVLALAIAQSEAGNIGVISAITGGNLQSHSAGQTYKAPQESRDAGYSYSANTNVPIPSYSSGPLQQPIEPQPVPHQHIKHIKVHQGLQSYPDHGYYSAPATAQYVKILKITHQEGQVETGDGQQPQHIQVIRVHHDNHDHDHSASVTTPIVQQNQAPTQPIKIIKVIHDQGPISTHHQIAQPIVQNDHNQAPKPMKVIKVYHDNHNDGLVNHGYKVAAAAASIESGWVPAISPSVRW